MINLKKINTTFLKYLLTLSTFHLIGQTNFKIENNFLLFENTQTCEPVLVFNDSTMAVGFGFETIQKIRFPKDLEIKAYNNYQYQIGNKTFLVDEGCGPVVTYKNGTFERIYNSFQHRNQYNAIPFHKNGQVYLWGGNGMFTYKNIFTKFNFKTGNWEKVNHSSENNLSPQSKSSQFNFRNNDELYVFGGYDKFSSKQSYKSDHLDRSIWKLDLNSFEWDKVGKLKLDVFNELQDTRGGFVIKSENKTVFVRNNIYEIDIKNNTLKVYKQKTERKLLALISHPRSKNISYVHRNSNGQLEGNTELYRDFKGDLLQETKLYSPKLPLKGMALTVGIIILTFVCFCIKSKINYSRMEHANKIVYNKLTDEFSFNEKVLIDFSMPKKEILKLLMEQNNSFIALSELNSVITLEPEKENYSAIKKRREVFLNELRREFSLMLGIEKDEIFKTKKNNVDRRIKEIKLNIEIVVI